MSSTCQVIVPRSEKVESIHRVSLSVVGANGEMVLSAGNPNLRTYFRSSAKPLQALPLLEAGGEEKFGFTSPELAVMSASHDGERIHTDTVRSILSKIGLVEENLYCGPHDPYHVPSSIALRREGREPTRFHNNCSGKHSGMLALAVLEGWPIEGYHLAEHPVQRRVFEVVSEALEQPASSLEYGTDGCGIPTFHLSVRQMAFAFSRFARWARSEGDRGDAVRRLIRAIAEAPVLVEGTTGFSSDLVAVTGGRIIGKVGGEGLYCMSIPDEGLGLALKVEDGNRRATSPAAVELLRVMNLITDRELRALTHHHSTPIINHQGTEIGRLKPEIIPNR